MSLSCLFGHKWDGCKCTKCGKWRDEQHRWDFCKGKCELCGKVCDEQHEWKKCKCVKCGKKKPHDWDRCYCRVCKKKREPHDWNHCTCRVCGEIRDNHVIDGCVCIICNKEIHDWKPFGKKHSVNNMIRAKCLDRRCSVCGKEIAGDYSHIWVQDGTCYSKCSFCGIYMDSHSYIKYGSDAVCQKCGDRQPAFNLDFINKIHLYDSKPREQTECERNGHLWTYDSHQGHRYLTHNPCKRCGERPIEHDNT